jgi:hypothetical protein
MYFVGTFSGSGEGGLTLDTSFCVPEADSDNRSGTVRTSSMNASIRRLRETWEGSNEVDAIKDRGALGSSDLTVGAGEADWLAGEPVLESTEGKRVSNMLIASSMRPANMSV